MYPNIYGFYRIPNPIGLVDNSENMLFAASQPQYLTIVSKHNYIVSHKIVVQILSLCS